MSASLETPPEYLSVVTDIWTQALGLPAELLPDSDVFEAGGTSMEVLAVSASLFEVLGVEVPLREIFKSSTPRALAQYIAASCEGRQR